MSVQAAGRVKLLWRRLRQQLWWRPAWWSAVAVAATAVSASADAWLPARWLPPLQDGVVDDLLHIMASSMLAVSTFALSVLVGAYASAANAGTPRATRLVVADPRSQRAVAAFLAAFIFAVVGLIALGTGHFGRPARLMLFACALAVLAWVIWSFMLYIDVISRIGRVSHTIEAVEQAARQALLRQARRPLDGARPADGPPAGARPLHAGSTGHVQFVDVPALQKACVEHDLQVHVAAVAGDLVHPAAPLLWMRPDPGPGEARSALEAAFVIGPERTVEQDAGFGLIVLGEIAQRALSPAVNDPGTAIAVLGSLTRLLIEAVAAAGEDPDAESTPDRVSAPPTALANLVPVAYGPVARAALGQPDVMVQLMTHLGALAANAGPDLAEAARRLASETVARAERQAADPVDLQTVRQRMQALGLADAGER